MEDSTNWLIQLRTLYFVIEMRTVSVVCSVRSSVVLGANGIFPAVNKRLPVFAQGGANVSKHCVKDLRENCFNRGELRVVTQCEKFNGNIGAKPQGRKLRPILLDRPVRLH